MRNGQSDQPLESAQRVWLSRTVFVLCVRKKERGEWVGEQVGVEDGMQRGVNQTQHPDSWATSPAALNLYSAPDSRT